MPTEEPKDNKDYCRAYYQRVKADPVKYAEKLRRTRENLRKQRAIKKSKSVNTTPYSETPEVAGDLTIEDLFE
jgi:hypothetical protein